MNVLFQQPMSSYLRLSTMMLLMWLQGVFPAAAQQEPDCFTYMPTATNTSPAMATHLNTTFVHDRGDGMAGEKLRVLIYYDPGTPISLGISSGEWETRIRASVLKFDTTLHNICVFDDYENINLYVKPSTIPIPGNTNDAYQASAIDQSAALYQMWTGEYQCIVPHIIGFIPPIEGASGARGVSTTVWEQFAETMTAIMVIRADQVNNPSDLTMAHELGHATGAFHPGDALAPNLSYCGFGTLPDGHRSIMKSPTTGMTIMNEGRINVSDCGALNNGVSDVGSHWNATYFTYVSFRPDFALETTATQFYIYADSQSTVLQTYVNRQDVDFVWTRNGYQISDSHEFEFVPTTLDTGTVVFEVLATNCGGEQITSTVEIEVYAKPTVPVTTGTNDAAWADFHMFPNPTSGVLYFDRAYHVQLFDMTGRVVLHRTDDNIDISLIPQGLYLAIVETDSGAKTRRIVSKIWRTLKLLIVIKNPGGVPPPGFLFLSFVFYLMLLCPIG